MIPAQDVGLQAALMGPLKMTEVSSLGFFYLFLEHVEKENKPKAACSQLFGIILEGFKADQGLKLDKQREMIIFC